MSLSVQVRGQILVRELTRPTNLVDVGQSLGHVLRMARPKPKDDARLALFGWLTDKEFDKFD